MRALRSYAAAVLALSAAMTLCICGFSAVQAFALPTTLCKSAQEKCLIGNRYGPTKIEASTTQITFTNTISNITCTKGSFTTETEVESGEPLTAKIPKEPLYENCTTASKQTCTIKAVNLEYKADIAWTMANQATLTLKNGGAGVPGVEVTCGLLIVCRFSKETPYEFKGGNPAKLEVTGLQLTTAGPTCPAKVELTTTYTVNSPNPVYPAHT